MFISGGGREATEVFQVDPEYKCYTVFGVSTFVSAESILHEIVSCYSTDVSSVEGHT